MTRERHDFLRSRVERMLRQHHLRVDDLQYLLLWLDEALAAVEQHLEPEQLELGLG